MGTVADEPMGCCIGCCCVGQCGAPHCESFGNEALSRLPKTKTENTDKGLRLVRLTPAEMDEALDVSVASFCGTASTDPEQGFAWALGSAFQEKAFDDPDRMSFLRWIHKWCFIIAVNYGMLLGARDAASGALLAVTFVLTPGNTHASSVPSFPAALCSPSFGSAMLKIGGGPPHEEAADKYPGCDERMKVMDKMMSVAHPTHAPGLHYYVWVMAVSPAAQGKGCCRFIFDAVSELADLDKVECYLETVGERNIKVYERLGYDHVKDYSSADFMPTDETAHLGTEAVDMAIMVRRCK